MKNSKLTTITDALLLTIAFVMFIDSVLEIKDTILLKTKLFGKVFRNEKYPPIEAIGYGRNLCDEDGGFTPLFNYTFYGVKGGSYHKETKTFQDESCKKDDTNCVNIPEVKRQYLTVFIDKVLCMKRMKLVHHNDEDYIVIPKGGACPSGYKQCGLFNHFGDLFCLKESLNCPINYLEFKQRSEIDLKDDTYVYIELVGDIYLVHSNKMTDNYLPVDFEVAENYPCLEYERISLNPEYSAYPRMINYDNFNCTGDDYKSTIIDDGLDKRYRELTSYDKDLFLFDNDLYIKYLSLPEVNDWENDVKFPNSNTIKFYSRSYISPNVTCASYDSYRQFEKNVDDLKVLKYVQMVLCLGNVLILCFFVSLLSLVKIIKRWFHVILNVVKLCLSIAFVVYSVIQSYNSFYLTQDIRHYIDMLTGGCTDEFIQASINRYDVRTNIKGIDYLNKYLYVFSLSYGVLLFLQLIRLAYKIWTRIKNRTRRREAIKQLGPIFINNKSVKDISKPIMSETYKDK